VHYWYPALSGVPSAVPKEGDESVHQVDLGILLVLDHGQFGVCWRMDGGDEWLGLEPPWMANVNISDYWVHNATRSWRDAGLLSAVIRKTHLWSYRSAASHPRQTVGIELRTDSAAVTVALGECDAGAPRWVADSVMVIFDSEIAARHRRSQGYVSKDVSAS
jgi:hypothetical protein